MRGIQPGQLTKRVILRRVKDSPTKNSDGAIDYSIASGNWENIGERWAKFQTGGGRESFQAEQIEAGITHTITMRRDSVTAALTPMDRLQLRGRWFGIVSVSDLNEMGEFVQATCVEAL